MAGKKGQIPGHLKIKKFEHPREDHPVIRILSTVQDFRKPSVFFRHSLTSILFMSLVAVICGAIDWPKVVVMAQGMKEWLSQYVDMSGGIPCERTFKTIFNSICPKEMEEALIELSKEIRQKIEGEIVSFDGQTMKGTADKRNALKGIHLLHAWSSENNICLGQLKVGDKSNEITAVPELMESLDLKGTVITGDALNTQKTIASKAIEKDADYLLPVKENHPLLYEEVKLMFSGLDKEQEKARNLWERHVEKAKEDRDHSRLEKLLEKGPSNCKASHFDEEIEKAHGRIEKRSCTAIPAGELPSKSNWEKLTSLVRVVRKRVEGDKESEEVCYYISSLKPKAEILCSVARKHWGVENGLHWRLDVIFRQDKSRYRDRVGARNLAVIRKMALHALSKETSIKGGIATKQCAACCNSEYRLKVLKKLF